MVLVSELKSAEDQVTLDKILQPLLDQLVDFSRVSMCVLLVPTHTVPELFFIL